MLIKKKTEVLECTSVLLLMVIPTGFVNSQFKLGPFRVVRFALLKIVLTNYPLEPYGFKSKLSCINKKKAPRGCIFVDGETNAINLELLLKPEYYTETMQTYKLVEDFLEKHSNCSFL